MRLIDTSKWSPTQYIWIKRPYSIYYWKSRKTNWFLYQRQVGGWQLFFKNIEFRYRR